MRSLWMSITTFQLHTSSLLREMRSIECASTVMLSLEVHGCDWKDEVTSVVPLIDGIQAPGISIQLSLLILLG